LLLAGRLLFSARRFGWKGRFVLRRWGLGRARSLLTFRLLDGTCFLRRFGIRFADTLPQAFQRVGAGLWAEPIIRAESLHDGLYHFLLNPIGTSVPFPEIEHFCESANDGTVTVSVLMFETEKFA
jgi:hypothetical protein